MVYLFAIDVGRKERRDLHYVLELEIVQDEAEIFDRNVGHDLRRRHGRVRAGVQTKLDRRRQRLEHKRMVFLLFLAGLWILLPPAQHKGLSTTEALCFGFYHGREFFAEVIGREIAPQRWEGIPVH